MDIKGKLILITGASSGIGAATARAAAARGAELVLLARSASKLDQVADAIRRAGGAARPYAVDLSDASAVEAAAGKILREAGVPDVVINNAGVGRWRTITDTSPQEAMGMMAVPYLAAFCTTQAFLPAMLERDQGLIANMTSGAALMGFPGATAYIASRWALRGFTEALRADLARTKIRVMQIMFAKVESEYWENNPGSAEHLPPAQALLRTLTPDQAAAEILKGIQRNQQDVIAPALLRSVVWFSALFPGITRRVMASQHSRA